MKKLFYLLTCDTCKRLMASWNIPESLELREIKSRGLSEEELDALHELTGSYEALFSKRARLYKERGLAKEKLGEEQFRALLLEHYTFLKRPVLIWDEQIFIGNSKKTAEAVQDFLKDK